MNDFRDMKDIKNWSNGNRAIALVIAIIGIFIGMQLLKLFFTLAYVVTIILVLIAACFALYQAVLWFQRERAKNPPV